MKRPTILKLMGVIVVLAVGLAALRDANENWSGGLMFVTPLFLCIATVGGLCGSERMRAGRLGFAVFGWAYFALVFLGLSEPNLKMLPTSRLLWNVHLRAAPPADVDLSGLVFTFVGQPPGAKGGARAPTPNKISSMNRWQAMMPGAADFDSFHTVGHCLFALLAGVLGTGVARRFETAKVAS